VRTCPTHQRRMVVADADRAYGITYWVCPEWPACHEGFHDGPEIDEIMRRENPAEVPR